MPDITKCINEDCPLNTSCWRFVCEPSEFNQSYAMFEIKDHKCEMFLEIPDNKKSDVVRLFG